MMLCFNFQFISATNLSDKETGSKEEGDQVTLDSVRFLGTAVTSICKSEGRGMPKAKPPYLKP